MGNIKCTYFLEMPNESTCFVSKCISALGTPYAKIHNCKESSSFVWSEVRNGYYPCTKASSTASTRAQQPPSHAVQSLLRSLPYTSPQTSTKPGQAVSLWIFSRRMNCPRTPRGLGHKSAQDGWATHFVSHQFIWRKVYLACRQLTKKEGKERKLPNKVFPSNGFPSPSHNLPSPRICCCIRNVTNQAMGTVHVGRARLVLRRGDGWEPHHPAVAAYIAAVQTRSALRPLLFKTVW